MRRGDGDGDGVGGSERDTVGQVTAPTKTGRSATVRVPDIKPIARGKLRLEGLVTDADDLPVAGARVAIGPDRTTTTEADGSFAFDDLAEGDYDVTAEAGDAFVEEQGVSLDDTSDPVTLQLVRGPTLVIRVVTEAGAPIEGANVAITGREHATGADGIVRLRGVAIDDERATVTAPGYAMQRDRIETSDDPAAVIEHTFVMHGGAAVAGVVIDASGKPVAEASVELEPIGGGRGESATTDERGAWTIPDIGRGAYAARASTSDGIAVADVTVVHDGAHPSQNIVLRIEAGGVIEGVVVDTSGHPVPDARVSGKNIAEKTDAAGRFAARGLVPDTYVLSVSTEQLGGPDTNVVLARGQHAAVKLVVLPSAIAGIVVDAHGRPVEDAAIGARMGDDAYGFARTDAYGHFDTGGLAPGRYVLTASRDGSSVDSKPVSAHTGDREVRIVVPDPAAITGRVVLDGRPVPYFGVAVVERAEESSYDHPDPVRRADGRFTVKDAQLGTFVVVIVGPTFQRKVIEGVRVASGEVTDLGDIVVEAGATIRGRVLDDRGAAVAGATVRMIRGSSVRDPRPGLLAFSRGEPFALTDARGEYALFGVELPAPDDDPAVLQATHPTAGISELHAVAAGETVVDLTLRAGGSIAGRITHRLPDMTMVEIHRVDARGLDAYADVDANDAFAFTSLPPGEYKVGLVGHSTLPAQTVTVTAGAPALVVFDAPEHPVELRLLRPGCETFTLRTADTDELLMFESCTEGAATMSGVAPGSYTLCADSTQCRPITVPARPVYEITVAE